MKAASFDYMRATSIDEACQALADADGEARVIAGGQTLVPLMAMRMARPALLVDINGIDEMSGIAVDGDWLIIGAGTRQAETLDSYIVKSHLPLLADALSHVGHDQTRNRGTVGGSLANADPAAELPLIARLLDAQMVARSINGTRTIAASRSSSLEAFVRLSSLKAASPLRTRSPAPTPSNSNTARSSAADGASSR